MNSLTTTILPHYNNINANSIPISVDIKTNKDQKMKIFIDSSWSMAQNLNEIRYAITCLDSLNTKIEVYLCNYTINEIPITNRNAIKPNGNLNLINTLDTIFDITNEEDNVVFITDGTVTIDTFINNKEIDRLQKRKKCKLTTFIMEPLNGVLTLDIVSDSCSFVKSSSWTCFSEKTGITKNLIDIYNQQRKLVADKYELSLYRKDAEGKYIDNITIYEDKIYLGDKLHKMYNIKADNEDCCVNYKITYETLDKNNNLEYNIEEGDLTITVDTNNRHLIYRCPN